MPIDAAAVRAVVFDYGNTLVPYGAAELAAYGDALAACLEGLYGPLDRAAFDAMRQAGRMAPFTGAEPTYRETDLRAATGALVARLYGRAPTDTDHAAIARVRHDAFVASIRPGDGARETLARLKGRFPLILLSNYPDAGAIRASLDAIGFAAFFDAVVVSGDLGYCKPHPVAFAAALAETGLPAQAVLHVGDNWLADVQGAKRVGMQAAQVTQYAPPEPPIRAGDDRAPDATLAHIAELPELLGC